MRARHGGDRSERGLLELAIGRRRGEAARHDARSCCVCCPEDRTDVLGRAQVVEDERNLVSRLASVDARALGVVRARKELGMGGVEPGEVGLRHAARRFLLLLNLGLLLAVFSELLLLGTITLGDALHEDGTRGLEKDDGVAEGGRERAEQRVVRAGVCGNVRRLVEVDLGEAGAIRLCAAFRNDQVGRGAEGMEEIGVAGGERHQLERARPDVARVHGLQQAARLPLCHRFFDKRHAVAAGKVLAKVADGTHQLPAVHRLRPSPARFGFLE